MTDNFDGDRAGTALDERFELLSAYLDGEVTATEKQQVEALLASDPEFQQQYRQMKQIHQAFPSIAVPSSQSAESLANNVFARIDRQRNRRLSWIGGAVAATLVVAVTGLSGLFGERNSSLQFASNTQADRPAPLMVALNAPILSIPAKGERTIELPMSSPEVNVD